jgi:hypothetical protein
MRLAFSPERLTLGLALVGLGGLWTLANLGWLDLLTALRRFWPALLIVWGALELLASLEARAAGKKR